MVIRPRLWITNDVDLPVFTEECTLPIELRIGLYSGGHFFPDFYNEDIWFSLADSRNLLSASPHLPSP